MKHSSLYRQRYIVVVILFFVLIGLFSFTNISEAQTSPSVTINEIRIDQPSADDDEYFELSGVSGTSLDNLTYIVIGDGAGGSGTIEAVVNLSGQTIPTSGFFVVAESTFSAGTADFIASLNFENSDNVTHLLVSNFTAANGDDLDTDDDGTLDSTPWDNILDSVGLVENDTGELLYSDTLVGPDGSFVPGHVYRCPDATGNFEIGDFVVGINDTPNAANDCAPIPDPDVTINEIRIDQPSNDDDEYFELAGLAGTSLGNLTYLVIGDGAGGSGTIEAVVNLSGQTIPASGFFVAAESTFSLGTADLVTSLNFENSDNVTHLLVSNFTGTSGNDLDTDDDGTLDSTPWDNILDSVGLVETIGSGDLLYSDTLVGPDGSFVPGHVYRCPDATGNFEIGGFGLGSNDTPGASNCSPTIAINEIRIDQSGSDNDEYFELASGSGTSLDGLTYLVIGDDGSGSSGVIEAVVNLDGQTVPTSGFFVAAESTFSAGTADFVTSLNFENSDNVTHLLVSNFTGANGDDLDTDDDGTLDSTPWDSILDSVGLVETIGSGELLYSDTLVGPDGSFVPAHVYRCPDATGNFEIGGFGLGSNDTPNNPNDCSTEPPPEPVLVRVHDIQGSGANVAITTAVIVEAVVIGDFQEDAQLDGFFIQEEDIHADANPATSEGIFVYCGSNNCGSFPVVNVGDVVRVTGTPSDFANMSQITANTIEVLSTGNMLPTSASISLPITAPDINAFYEQYEGMLVSYTNTLVVSEYFQLARYGQITLYGDARPYQFTDENVPSVVGNAAHLEALSRNQVILDDDNNFQNSLNPIYHPQPNGFSVGTQGVNYFRGGDTVSDLTGVLHWSWAGQSGTDSWRIRPVDELPVAFAPVNTRLVTPTPVGGNVSVASLNVLNYFTSIDGPCNADNPAGQCRGADSPAELIRQTQQTVTALMAMDADIVGLVEIENNGTAVATLVDELNAVVGAGTYAYINTGIIGSDAITTAIIYKPAVVSPIGFTVILDDPAFVNPLNDTTPRNRPAVTQSFEVSDLANPDYGAVFTVIVNHLKSKGGTGSGLDADQNDGAGAFNESRRLAADYMVNTWIPSNPTGISDPDYIILGDLNAYAMETPISTIVNAGYTDLIDATSGGLGYSYVFNGQLGYLDYALANSTLYPQVVGVTEWHVNADEVPLFDYNDSILDSGESDFEQEPIGNELFTGDGFRNSDHDPVIVGLDLIPNQAPIVDAGEDITIDEGSIAYFSGSFTDADSPTGEHIIEWDFGATTLNASQYYDDGPATIEVTLSVTDEFGAVGTDTLIVTVNNVAPTASLAAIFPDPTFQGEFNTFVFSNQYDPSQADTDFGFSYGIDCTPNNGLEFTRTTSDNIQCQLVDAGSVTVTGVIQDKDQGMTMYTVTVEVLSPLAGYDYVRSLITTLQAEAGLNNGQTNALTSKVDNSERQYLRNNDNPAINQLQALINQLQALENSNTITEEQRATVANAVQRLMISIGSGY